MKPIIEPIDKNLLKAELTPEKKVRDTNKANNEIYIVSYHDSPNLMREIGRLREEAFRVAGAGTGLACDIDKYDMMEKPYSQLIVWDTKAETIIGGYRFILGRDIVLDEKNQPVLATAKMFHFSEKFIKEYLPYTVELGRSFVSLDYQKAEAGVKALFALDNLFDGLAAVMLTNPDMKYFFGKVTMYPDFNREARDIIHHFLWKHFGDKEELVRAYEPLVIERDKAEMDAILYEPTFKEDYKLLNAEVRRLGENIPPLVNSYMNLSHSMKMFGGGINHDFTEAEETCILITFDDLYEEKKARHVDSFRNERK